jgi:nitroreductase
MDMKTRRMFLAELLFSCMVLGGSALGGSCSLQGRDGISAPVQHGQVTSPPLDPISQKILHHASLAPSGHNCQPWRVRICRHHEWIIEADPARRLPCVDPDNRELLLSLGAFLENLSITAATLGLHAEFEILARDRQELEVARVVLQERPTRDYRLKILGRRHTVKNGQLPRVLDVSDRTLLMATGERQTMYAPRGSKQAAYIEEMVVEAFRLQARREDAQQEFVRWLRLDYAEVMHHRDGITTDSMGLSGTAGWYVNTFLSPDDFLTDKMRQKSIDATATMAREGGGWLLLASRDQTPAELLVCGRRFQRLALAACELGIAIHPMSQILEEKIAPSLYGMLGDDTAIPQFVLRVGYLNRYPVATGLRRPVAWFAYS